PLQVFDDGRSTWLQFMPDQALPAIFARGAQGDQLLDYRHQGPYVVLDGVWPFLILKAGLLESRAQRLEPPAAAPVRESTDGGAARPADQGDEAESAGVAERLEIANRAEITEATPLPVSLPQDTQAAAPAPAPLWETPVFRVSPQDG